MNAALIIRATHRWLKPAQRDLGEQHVALRRLAYNAAIDSAGLRRDPEHQLRVRAGQHLQRELTFRPIPAHRALVPIN